MEARSKPHVLAIPHCTKGHITPLLRFCKKLAAHGVTITFVSYENELSNLASEDLELSNLDITLIGIPSRSRNHPLPSESAEQLRKDFQPLTERLFRDKNAGIRGPSLIVSDMFLVWTKDLAFGLGIPKYIFVPSGVCLARMIQVTEDLFIQDKLRVNADNLKLPKFEGKMSIPGLPALRYHELTWSCIRDPVRFQQRSKDLCESTGVIVNSFYCLEATIIDTFEKPPESTILKAQKIYPVGPLFPTSTSSPPKLSASRELEDSQEGCLRWLGSQPESSVLYICFGSMFQPQEVEIKQLAVGLEKSGQRFLWVLPRYKTIDPESLETSPVLDPVADLLPPGFQAQVGERGYIETGWAPQIQILSHKSTAGFLTHCGWNSSLEAISFGVPMLGWPIGAEQYLNCRYLVDEMKIAIEIEREAGSVAKHEDIENAIRHFMVESKAMKSRVDDLKVKASEAVGIDGSSTCAILQFAMNIQNS